jgi:beta-aspartyl-peptidase (threonine type)
MNSPYAIVVHGGAGFWPRELWRAALHGVRRAARRGAAVLADGGSALDAAVEAVVALEDAPAFNAGTGSVLNRDGEVEMDAGVMDGATLTTGNVALLRRVRNPVRVARRVMEATPHVLLAGEGALAFARAEGFADYDPVTTQRRAEYARRLARTEAEQAAGAPQDTVGAVALDRQGRIAAATSTGGVSLKMPGRVGDSPIPGAGNYATGRAGASATGRGELVMRVLATKGVCDRIASGSSAEEACVRMLEAMRAGVGSNVGLIALDSRGSVGIAHGTEYMPHAFFSEGRGCAVARLSRR